MPLHQKKMNRLITISAIKTHFSIIKRSFAGNRRADVVVVIALICCKNGSQTVLIINDNTFFHLSSQNILKLPKPAASHLLWLSQELLHLGCYIRLHYNIINFLADEHRSDV